MDTIFSTLEIIFCIFLAEISVDFEINFVKVLIPFIGVRLP